ncbi:phosphoribosylanthranilate isomerase [Streptomyces tanashiensis]|uniref:N-(5'-phosphoribosyl)anthranilate isomerase n=1 Tax=Streptomyces tanashiensis TaxID=67367 RepID=A0ABY6QSM8_9ACTN|nr:phosphoribosylanthranilate isomerase [Streptomyces tanashiensis]UZX19514.1 phosphoribosylanthranilate isomerase [Streptomyces tanashiensis]GGY17558.1 N-(5'-phosphoribosyl)anthranilate isomerase [Streptomyces tanashiensis]
MFVKVCGLGTVTDIDVAVAAGADAVGLVVSGTSVRGLDPERAVRLAAHVPPGVLSVLVVNDTPAVDAARMAGDLGIGALQLHGRAYREEDFAAAAEVFPRLWRATSLSDRPDTRVGAYGEEVLLLDSPRAGSGEPWDLSLLDTARPEGAWLLAGGLAPHNVGEAIGRARPWGVDVSSGVESAPGVKDHDLIRAFVTAAKQAVPQGA